VARILSRLSPSRQKKKRPKDKKSEIAVPLNKKNESSTENETALPLDSDVVDTSPASIARQLRQFGLVVRYFGEENEARIGRLKAALEKQSQTLQGLSELEEYRLGKGHGIRNPFLGREKDNQQKQASMLAAMGEASQKKKARLDNDSANKASTETDNANYKKEEEGDDQSDPPKMIYKFLKGLLKQWEQELAERPESVARSVAGRNESKTLKQCKDYIRPLFKLLKSRKLEDGLQFHLLKIVNFAKEGEFVKAHDAYMDVAIGRAAWPIGVTMVGIHARSGRAKIESSNVAHVMNSELQRKYLTSVKRLLSYAQKTRPDVDPSKKVA